MHKHLEIKSKGYAEFNYNFKNTAGVNSTHVIDMSWIKSCVVKARNPLVTFSCPYPSLYLS